MRILIILILIFLPIKALADIGIGVYPIKVKGSPYPYLSKVITQEVVQELENTSDLDIVKLEPNQVISGYIIKGSIVYHSGIFIVNLGCYIGKKAEVTLKKQVKGSELFIVVKKFCQQVQQRFSSGSPGFFSRFLKKLNPFRIIFPQRGFELDIPVPLPVPPQELLNSNKG